AVRRLEALVEDLAPGGLRQPPEPVPGQDLVRVGREAAAGEAGVHLPAEPLEVPVDLRVAWARIRHAVLLVGCQRELAPRAAAEDEPGPGGRRRTVPPDREVDEPRRERVELEREHAPDVGRGDT